MKNSNSLPVISPKGTPRASITSPEDSGPLPSATSSSMVISLPSITSNKDQSRSNTHGKINNNQIENDGTTEESDPTTITISQPSPNTIDTLSSTLPSKIIPTIQKPPPEAVDTSQILQPSLLLENNQTVPHDVDTEDEDDDEVDYDSDEGHDTTHTTLLTPTVNNSSGKNNPNATPWATADALCYLVDCNNQFLKVSGINREDLPTVSIINLVRHTTPEKMMQQAYSLDELVSGKVDAGMKWTAELNETYKNINYMIHVTLADPKNTKSGKPCVMDVTLKPAVEGPQGHTVVNGNLEWGLRRRSSINVLENRMRALSFRNSSVNASAINNASEKSNNTARTSSMVLAAAEEAQRRCSTVNANFNMPQLRVLLVDDSLLALKVLSRLIVAEGHHVESNRSGEAALELLKNHHFDAVLITMNMPDMSGMEASLDLRRHQDLMQMYKSECGDEKLKIIAMVQAPDLTPEKKRDILRAGFDNYVAKPVSLEAFRELNLRPIPVSYV